MSGWWRPRADGGSFGARAEHGAEAAAAVAGSRAQQQRLETPWSRTVVTASPFGSPDFRPGHVVNGIYFGVGCEVGGLGDGGRQNVRDSHSREEWRTMRGS